MQTQRFASNSSKVIHARQRPLCTLSVDVASPLTTKITYVSKEARLALFGKAKEQVRHSSDTLAACPHISIICDSCISSAGDQLWPVILLVMSILRLRRSRRACLGPYQNGSGDPSSPMGAGTTAVGNHAWTYHMTRMPLIHLQYVAWLISCFRYTSGMKHMFDGYSMVAKLRLHGGKAFGSQKFIQSKAYRCERRFHDKLLDMLHNLLQVSLHF